MDAIILAGGLGKRLRPLTDKIPKCMVPINGKPMIQYHIDQFKKYGIKKIIVACGYKWEKIKEFYGNSLIYSIEKEPLGTAGAIKKALDYVDGYEYIVVNADDINNVNIDKFVKIGSNAIVVARFHCRFGIVDIEGNKVVRFRQKPLLPYWANMGMYLLNKDIKLPDKGAIETEVFPKIELKAYKHNGFWMTVNTRKDLEEVEKCLKGKDLF